MNPVCLDEARALAFVSGQLAVAARAEVEDHIDDCASCRQVVAAMVRRTRGPEADAGVSATAWRAGTRVGRYLVGESIGRGGMGAVWKARDLELGRMVALKRLLSGADDDARARLVREARVAAQLDHANVVTVYEVGEDAGVPWLAMELVDGVGIAEWARGKSWREVVAMMVQAGRGLAAAHARGLVHRDFKPDNVLVDGAGRARVADFGLARAVATVDAAMAAGDAAIARMTTTGTLAGTPAYLAPELVAGALPDARSDQYGFAVTLYEALHGQHPFGGATAAAMWTRMAAGKVKDGTRAVPAWVDKAVRRGLAPEPEARWGSVEEMVAALERGVKGGRGRGRMIGVAAGAAVAATVAVVIVVVSSSKPGTVAAAAPVSAPAAAAVPAPVAVTAPAPVTAAVSGSEPAAVSVPAAPKPTHVTPVPPPKKKTKQELWDAASDADDPKLALSYAEQAAALDPSDGNAQRIATYWACFARDEARALKHGAHLSHHQWQLVIGECSRADIMLPEPAEDE